MGMGVAPPLPSREWRDLYGALDCSVAAAVHPFYTASVREFRAAGRPVVGSGPVGVEGTAAWLDAVGLAAGVTASSIDEGEGAIAARDPRRPRRQSDRGPDHGIGLRRGGRSCWSPGC